MEQACFEGQPKFEPCDLAVFLHPVVVSLETLPVGTPPGVINDLTGQAIGTLPARGVLRPTSGSWPAPETSLIYQSLPDVLIISLPTGYMSI